MSQQGPLLIVASAGPPPFAAALAEAQMFPLIETDLASAAGAVEQVQPAAALVDAPGADSGQFADLARAIARRKPYLPVIAVEPNSALADNALPFAPHRGNFDRLPARLRAVALGERMGVVGAFRVPYRGSVNPTPLGGMGSSRKRVSSRLL
jgi:hypothetical protein